MKRRQIKDVPSPEMYNGHGPMDEPAYHQGTKAWLESLACKRHPQTTHNVTAYNEYMPEMCYQLRLMGATNPMIATCCKISEQMLQEWCSPGSKTFKPALYQAMIAGAELADARVAEAMWHKAVGYTHPDEKLFYDKDIGVVRAKTLKHYPPDAQAGVFWLTNRQKGRWTNRVVNEMTGVDGQPLAPPQLIIQGVQPSNRHPAALERDMQRTAGNGASHGNGKANGMEDANGQG